MSRSHVRVRFAFAFVVALAACSGGGSGSLAPNPGASVAQLPGAGTAPKLDQLVTLTVNVPAPGAPPTAARRRAAVASAATPAPPYVSPNIGSLTIELQTVDGVAVTEPVTTVEHDFTACPAGCSVAIGAIEAARGSNGYVVKTFAQPHAQGALLSIGIVIIDVPGSATAIGANATLSVGGYVNAIVLHVTPDPPFKLGVAGTAGVVAQALDATGAAIVGNVRFANPITVALASNAFFLFDKQFSTVTVPGPQATPIALFYTGGDVRRGSILATTTDASGAAVAATPLPIVVTTPSPSPTPTHTATPVPLQTALYIHDSFNDLIYEIDRPAASGSAVRRLQLPSPNSTTGGIPACQKNGNVGAFNADTLPAFSGFAVDSTANLYVATQNCLTDTGSGTAFEQIVGIPAAAVGNVAASSLSQTDTVDETSDFLRLGFSQARASILASGTDSLSQSFNGSTSVQDFVRTGGGTTAPTLTLQMPVLGSSCLPELAPVINCNVDAIDAFGGIPVPTAIDASGDLFVGFSSGVQDSNGNALSAIAVYGAPVNLATSTLVPALEMKSSAFVDANGAPVNETQLSTAILAMATDAKYLYVLNLANSGYGLSNCSTLGATVSACSDMRAHDYVTMYALAQIAASLGSTNQPTPLQPSYVIGGQDVGRFGPDQSAVGNAVFGQRLTVIDGLLVVANPYGASCDAGCTAAIGIAAQPASEIDVFDTNALPPPPKAGDPPTILLNLAPTLRVTAQTLGMPAVPGILQDVAAGPPSGATGGFTTVRTIRAWRHSPLRRINITRPRARRTL